MTYHPRHVPLPYRLLVVANETLDTDAAPARDVVDRHPERASRCSSSRPPPRAGSSAGHRTTALAGPPRQRLRRCLGELRARAASSAEGLVGDGDPLLAIEDALRLFDADEVVVASAPGAQSGELASDLAEQRSRAMRGRVRNLVVGVAACGAIAA